MIKLLYHILILGWGLFILYLKVDLAVNLLSNKVKITLHAVQMNRSEVVN